MTKQSQTTSDTEKGTIQGQHLQSRAGKDQAAYWKKRVKHRKFKRGGRGVVVRNLQVRIKHAGKEGWFNLETDNRDAKHKIFCAKRAWSHRAEIGRMQDVENSYQRVANAFKERDGPLTSNESKIVTDMYVLWCVRAAYKNAPQVRVGLKGVEGDQLSRELLERCEKLGVVTVGPDSCVAAREIYGDQIVTGLTYYGEGLKNVRWTCKVFEGENMIVPDEFGRFAYMPLSPTRVFIDMAHQNLSGRELNDMSVRESKDFCFQYVLPGLMRSFKPRVSVMVA